MEWNLAWRSVVSVMMCWALLVTVTSVTHILLTLDKSMWLIWIVMSPLVIAVREYWLKTITTMREHLTPPTENRHESI